MTNSSADHSVTAPVGAVMVVGGGIAGMQASLDLAEQGFKVYLVESQTAIGGKMAQLDKTFPTNDCAMCTISPKLVETGRHPNIAVMTGTEVLDVDGQVGDFAVRVHQKPRYIDLSKCVGCGDCAKACPIVLPDNFNQIMASRHAAYKLYPQAVPNGYAIEKLGVSPCRDACPIGQHAQGYIALVRDGRWQEAMRTIKLDNPFPGICGRICNHRCEDQCNRGKVDEPVNIHALKRYVADKVYAEPRTVVEPVPRLYDQRVAIIGAGPCGLTAAQDLVKTGYRVTVYESAPVAGGMMRLGVPEYRLPSEIVEREVQDIVDLGVDLRLNHRVEDLDTLFAEGFSAVLIAVGAQEGVRLPIPGADLPGVLINTEFLRDARLGKYQNGATDVPELGQRVLVLGGGNVAMDVARTARRLGREVHLACLECGDQMTCHQWELQEAQEEGVITHQGLTFDRILGNESGHVAGMECQKVASFGFDDVGRLHVEKVPDSTHTIPCDTIIFSVGQRVGSGFLGEASGVELTRRRTVAVDSGTLATSRTGIFAAGDSVTSTTFVVDAIKGGHDAAQSIIRYLRGEELRPIAKPQLPVVRMEHEEIDEKLASGEITRQSRIPVPALPLEQRTRGFTEVEGTYDDEAAVREAQRCLSCGLCSECMSCTVACQANAIDHTMLAHEDTIHVGAIILAPGYQTYRAELSEEYGLGRYPNVVTSLQFERLLSSSGPTSGHVLRPSDQKEPRSIAFLQCIGSRDKSHDYCSAVCCMYAAKEAVIAKEHNSHLEIKVFMMDMRAFSKGYWGYFERARDRYGVQFIRCRISALHEDPHSHDLILRYRDEDGEIREERFDMTVLSVGMEISESVRELGRRLGVELDDYGFCHTVQFNPLETSRPGIFAAGPFREPKDIPESIVDATGAAAAAAAHVGASRFTLTTKQEFPPERDVSREEPRIGVFVCHCGSNIGGYLDVPDVVEYAKTLPNVTYAESNLYTCSQDSTQKIAEEVKEYGLNRVVVASCSPLTHQPLFQECIRTAGLNPYLFEMANIRNQCSWVHSNQREPATDKAKDLVRMAVAKAALLQPQHTVQVPVHQAALVVGGGAAGMTAAVSLAEQGFAVHLVERESELGGNLRWVFLSSDGRDPQKVLRRLVEGTTHSPKITVHLDSKVIASSGFTGNFISTLQGPDGGRQEISHAITILATGAQEYRGPEYGYGSDPRVVTQQQFESLLAKDGVLPDSVAMIQCVGPAEKFCSRICCTVALKNALKLKELKPEAQVVILYKDIRTYGFKERLYTGARERGVLFIRYDDQHRPQVNHEGELVVQAWDPVIKRQLTLRPGLLVLSAPVVPNQDAREVAGLFKTHVDADGFFLEAHVKLRPVDFATDGVYMAGMAHYPKLLDETMVQAQAAAARAARVLCRDSLTAGGRVAVVDESKCVGCLTCVRLCPFGVPRVRNDPSGSGGVLGVAHIEAAVCQGCGSCSAECPARAIQLMHFTDSQMIAKVGALPKREPADGASRALTGKPSVELAHSIS